MTRTGEGPFVERDLSAYRDTEYPVASLFRDRWSPRAMSGEPLGEDELMSLFEAARWAPSSSNNQPWRFLYALRDSEHWPAFFELLTEGNRVWAVNAAVLLAIVAKTTFDNGKPSVTHAFDTGAAWENLALQGSLKGLVVHGMEGFDYEHARQVLHLPGDHVVLAMAAVGRPGDPTALPEKLQRRETPSDRKPLSAIAIPGPMASPDEN